MGNFWYILYKNKAKIVAVSIVVICTVVAIVVAVTSSKKGSPDDITDSGGTVIDNEGTAIITVAPDEDDGIREILEKQTVVRVIDRENNIYEVVLDKINNGMYLFINNEQTETRCRVEDVMLDESLMTLNESIDGIPITSVERSKVSGVYEINSNTASGVINHLKKLGAQEIRRVETQKYFEVYLKEKDNTVKRIIVTKELMFIAEFKRDELPVVSSYWHEY